MGTPSSHSPAWAHPVCTLAAWSHMGMASSHTPCMGTPSLHTCSSVPPVYTLAAWPHMGTPSSHTSSLTMHGHTQFTHTGSSALHGHTKFALWQLGPWAHSVHILAAWHTAQAHPVCILVAQLCVGPANSHTGSSDPHSPSQFVFSPM